MGAQGQVVDQIWEKVDDPATLTPESGQAEADATPSPGEGTETPDAEPTTEGDEGSPLPLESAPEPTSEGQ